MKKYIVIDHEMSSSRVYDNRQDVMVAMGGDPGETTLKETMESGEGVFELIEINDKGELKYLLKM